MPRSVDTCLAWHASDLKLWRPTTVASTKAARVLVAALRYVRRVALGDVGQDGTAARHHQDLGAHSIAELAGGVSGGFDIDHPPQSA